MKATRTNYDEMWDKYFDSYQGWLYVADRICPSQERQNQKKILFFRKNAIPPITYQTGG